MNWQHLRTFLWLRWRLMANSARRGGKINAILTMIIVIAAMAMALPLGVAALVAGLLLAPQASPTQLMFAWDGLVMAFMFFWSIGLLTELQRSETLSVDRFLHLPVSVRGVFAINYVSSLVRLSMLVFAPVMLGFALALVFVKGPRMLVALPLTAALLLMITAISYQFQGWLASLMSNPRRRRTVTVMSVAIFVMVCQLPQLFNVIKPWQPPAEQTAAKARELSKLDQAMQATEITPQEYLQRSEEVRQRYAAEHEATLRDKGRYWQQIAVRLNQFLPIGWLPLGVMSAAEGSTLPALLGLTGMTLVGSASLWRAYRTTLRLYQGGFTAGSTRRGKPVAAQAKANGAARGTMLEWRLPCLSETVSAVALAGFRSLLRAPEAKMMLLTPLLMGGIFGAMLVSNAPEIPIQARPLLAFGGMMLVLFGMLQVMGNQFGFDRDGFRAFVLSAVDRREILLGKNLSFAPFAMGLIAFMLIVAQIVVPLNAWQLLAAPLQFAAMFLLFCLVVNILSIYTPLRIASGSLKVSHPNLATVLLQVSLFAILFPLVTIPAAGALAGEGRVTWQGMLPGSPVNLLLSLLSCAATALLYRAVLAEQAKALQSREQKILDTITNRAA